MNNETQVQTELMEVAKRIRDTREVLSLSPEQMAKNTGLFTSGNKKVSTDVVEKILEYVENLPDYISFYQTESVQLV